jgi:poly-gamma-glutamate synthesis protein (capsule biosynthesis protein)
VTFEEGMLSEIRVYPLDLLQDHPRPSRGMPTVAEGEKARKILNTLRELSEEYGTDIEIDDGVGFITV